MTRRRERQLAQLEEQEASFERELIAALRACSAGQSSLLFMPTELLPAQAPRSVRCSTADSLWRDAGEILAERRRLDLGGEECLAHRFREECRHFMNEDDHHRLGARRRAEELLARLV